MYLFVFVFLVMSVVGLYTEVYALQAAKMYQNRTDIAQMMLTWHESARKWAQDHDSDLDNIPKAKSQTGCFIIDTVDMPTVGTNILSARRCHSGGSQKVMDAAALPLGYNFSNFRFRTIVYTNAPSRMIITYVQPPATATIPAVAGFTLNQLNQQLVNSHISPMMWGVYNGTNIVTKNSIPIPGPTVTGGPQAGSLVLVNVVPN